MSRLDADFAVVREVDGLLVINRGKLTEKAKQQIKAMVLEIIGEDEPDEVVERLDDGTEAVRLNPRNTLRAELRKKVESL